MNVFNKVTIQSLKKNKTRTVVTIIGIMLSAAMICAVTTFVSSIQNYLMDYAIYNEGDWHGSTENVDFETYMDINSTGELSDSTYNQILGYAKIESKNEYKPYMYVIGGDKVDFFNMLPIHLISGNYPTNENEIILPEHLLTDGGLKCKVGDSITLDIGERLFDGYAMTQNNPCYTYDSEIGDDVINDETIEVVSTRTYKIVGIYERPSFEDYTAPGYTAITVSDKEFNDSARFDVYFKMENPSQVYDFMERLELNGSQNSDVLMFSGISKYDTFTTMLVSLASIVIGLIMFGSVSLIYNAFAISVSERTKQFGLLSSVGATKKQLKKMVLFEALAVSTIGIPLGIGVGISGIAVTLILIGNKFASMLGSYGAPLRICVSWESVVIAIIVALITVLISAWIPSKRATKISAVEAIRQNTDIKAKNKQVKTSKLAYKFFGLPGVLASKHYKRNKKKYRTTVISLFMSIVLFVSASSFTGYLMDSITDGFTSNEHELVFDLSDDDLIDNAPDDVLSLLMTDRNVTKGTYLDQRFIFGLVSRDYLTDEFVETLGEHHDQDDIQEEIQGYIYFVKDSEFNTLIKKYNLNKEDYYDTENPLAIAIDETLSFDQNKQKFVRVDTIKGDECEVVCQAEKEFEGYAYGDLINENGKDYHLYVNRDDNTDVIKIPYEEGYEYYTLRSEKTITEYPFYMNKSSGANLYMLYPLSMRESVLPASRQDDNYSYAFYLQSDNHAASFENLETILLENNLESKHLIDIAANEEANRNIVNIIQVFSYGFIVLISLIAAANVFNTISTNISLRRREFAMLKSVGMTQKGFNRMMNYECLLYGSKALMLGLPVSAGITYLIYKAVSGGMETSYYLPWTAIGISVLSVFLVVFVTMLYSMSKIKKENPIDALKNENL